ncbi:unnamed protein product, partial [marine sediment metagenome]
LAAIPLPVYSNNNAMKATLSSQVKLTFLGYLVRSRTQGHNMPIAMDIGSHDTNLVELAGMLAVPVIIKNDKKIAIIPSLPLRPQKQPPG